MASVIVLVAIAIMIVFFIFYKKPVRKVVLPSDYQEILSAHVNFYKQLDEENKRLFEEKIKEFLGYVRIEGIDTNVEELDKLLVASSAVIPVFGFKRWKYFNLDNVLLYPGTFNKDEFLASGYEKNTLGMIGNGPMQRVMILSKQALRNGFLIKESVANTGIHEFVHLLDKEDGAVDGLPEALLNRTHNKEWLKLMDDNIELILQQRSDISTYAATNKSEFFAVISEYFFNQPQQFKKNHEDLYRLMCLIFNQEPIKE